jgi:hypothetical protein
MLFAPFCSDNKPDTCTFFEAKGFTFVNIF